MSYLPKRLGLSLIIGGLLVRGALGVCHDVNNIVHAVRPVPLTDFERQSTLLFDMIPPMSVDLEFEPLQDIKNAKNAKAYAYTIWSYYGINRCTIHLPTTMAIEADPLDDNSGHFVDDFDADTIAHELMHCLHADWHKPH